MIRFQGGQTSSTTDLITVEEPLEIRVVAENGGRRKRQSIAVTMRTPGDDHDLAAGFLVSEGVVREASDIWKIEHCREDSDAVEDNIVDVYLAPSVRCDVSQLSRKILTSSACGICGRASIESVQQICSHSPHGDFRLRPAQILRLPEVLQEAQGVFAHTGGLHAAALFSPSGERLQLCEDVGRHNALDKIVGGLLARRQLPARDRIVVVSGRASFELVQKCLLAGVPFLAAVGAPSSLAIDLAAEYEMTLIGFLREDRFNVYCGAGRIDSK